MAEQQKIKFSDLSHFSPKQKEANAKLKKIKFLLYGGAMYGGKSYWLRWALLELLIRAAVNGHRGLRAGLFSEDYPTLADRQLCKIKVEFPAWLGTYKETAHEFILAPEYGGGTLCFRNLDDPSKYQSSEFAFIGVEELTKNPYEVFTMLRTRLRWPNFEDVKFLAATNPGDIGHTWVKKLFIDKEFDENEQEQDQFGFIQALAVDNPNVSPSYLRSLDSLPEELRKAYRDGNWEIFKGQFFGEWRARKNDNEYHVVASYAPTKADIIFGSMDWGFDPDSFCYHLHAAIKVHTSKGDFTRIKTFAELYGNKQYPKDWSVKIKNLEKGFVLQGRYSDPSAGNRHPSWTAKEAGGDSVLAEFSNYGITFTRGNNDKKNGYQTMRNWLAPGPDGLPLWQVCSCCTNLIKQMPAAIFDPNNSFIVKEGGEDHAVASARYGLMSQPANTYTPAKQIGPNTYDFFHAVSHGSSRQKVGV